MDCQNSIRRYFAGKNIFITGGSGFIGKALIEKVLRSCPDVEKLYVLVRPKKGKVLYERVEQMTSSPLFDTLKSKNPENLKKIVPINGDITKSRLGLSDIDRKLLKDEVHVVFHIAASVLFDDFLNKSILANLKSTQEAALLALDMKNIEVFLHVSTSYCNIDNRKVVEEILYPSPGDWKEVILAAENVDTNTFNVLSQKYIGEFPNTYTYTKRLGEHCINDLLVGKVPTIICRPSVVVGTMGEPFQGWIDNFNGPVGLLCAGATGLLRVLYADPESGSDITGVDNNIKCMIVSAWKKAISGDVNNLSIYHLSNNDSLPFKVGDYVSYGRKLMWDVPFEKKIWFPRNRIVKCWYEYYINVILFHMIPAFFLDLLLRIVQQKPMLFKLQRKIYIANIALSHFMHNDWKFDNRNTLALYETMPDKEKGDFNFLTFPIGDLSIYEYYLNCAKYCRENLLKESKGITRANFNRTRRMYYLDIAVRIVFYLLSAWLFILKINVPAKLWNVTSDYWDSL